MEAFLTDCVIRVEMDQHGITSRVKLLTRLNRERKRSVVRYKKILDSHMYTLLVPQIHKSVRVCALRCRSHRKVRWSRTRSRPPPLPQRWWRWARCCNPTLPLWATRSRRGLDSYYPQTEHENTGSSAVLLLLTYRHILHTKTHMYCWSSLIL